MSELETYVRGYCAGARDVGWTPGGVAATVLEDPARFAVRSWDDPDWARTCDSNTYGDRGSARRATPQMGTVYLAASNDGRIKIGHTKGDPHKRVRTLAINAGVEASLIASFRATRKLESDLHERFAYLRIRGEWFRDDPAIRQWIRSWQK